MLQSLNNWLTGVAWALFLVENSPYHILPVSEFGCYAEEIYGGLRPPSPKLVDERLIGGYVGEGTHYVGVSGVEEFVSFLEEPSDVIL